MSNGIGRVWAVNAEGGDEGRPNGVGPVYIENADQLGSKLPEPAAGDAGKVLGVLNSDGDIGWVEDQSGTLTQVQSDWAEDDSSQVSYIQNKPTLATVATSGSYADLSNKPTIPTVDQVYDSTSANAQSGVAVAGAISGKQDTISDLETIRSGAAAGATSVQPSQLATVATSGSYADLRNRPSIPAAQVQSDWNQANDQAVDYIKNKPTIPAAQVNSDWNASSGVAEILNKPTLATVATSGSYNDLSNKPSIPAAQVQSDWNQTNDQAVDFIKNKPTIPAGVVVDQSYSASSTNAQSGTAVADALATINQVPASTSADEDKVLTVDSNGDAVWAAAQGGGSSYTFSAPLSESSGTVSLSLDSNTLKTQRSTTDVGFSNSLQNSNGYAAGSVGVSGTSDIVVSMTIHISQDLYGQKAWQNKTILPILIGDTGWNSYSNQWVLANASVSVNQGAGSAYSLTCEFTINASPSSPNYPTSLNGTTLSNAFYLAFGVFDSASALTARSSSQIYGASDSTATYQYGSALTLLAVKNPVPSVTSSDNGKVLKATYSNGVGSFGWDDAPTELPASLGTAGQVLTVNSGATGVEWATVQSGSSYTAGAGIDISAQDEISVKAGNGITIADYTYEHTGPINLTATPVLNQGSYSAPYIAQLTQDMLDKMNSTGGLQVTLNGAYDGGSETLWAGLATNVTTFQTDPANRVVFGEYPLGTSIAAGTTVTFDFAERNGSLSTKSYADVAANVSSYYLVIFWYYSSGGFEMVGNAGQAAPSADPITTGTYTGTETVTVQNAVNLSTPIEVVAAMPASPTSGVLYIVTGS